MQSSFNKSFPVEIICMILSHLPSIEVARNSRVCKHWNKIINDKKNRALWKDASYLEKQDTRTPFELVNKRLKILCKRSGGSLNHLNIQISTSGDFKAQMRILNEIPTMNLYGLRLVLGNGPGRDEYPTYPDGVSKFLRMQLAIQTAIANCTDLKSLVIEDRSGFLNPEEKPILRDPRGGFKDGEPFKWELYPFFQCKQDTFIFIGHDYMEFMRQDMLLHILSQARIIKIETFCAIPEFLVIRLMDTAKDTLEQCHLGMREVQGWIRKFRKINLPRLIKFSLNVNVKYNNFIYYEDEPTRIFRSVSFHWPVIKEITLEGQAILDLYKRLLPPSLESLRLRNIHGLRLEEIISLLTKQKSLKKLSIENLEENTNCLLYHMLLKIPHIPLEELEIRRTYSLHGERLRDFIKQRRDNPLSTPIKRLYASLPPKMPQGYKTIKWLEKNVEYFKYDRSSPQQ